MYYPTGTNFKYFLLYFFEKKKIKKVNEIKVSKVSRKQSGLERSEVELIAKSNAIYTEKTAGK